MEEVKDGMGTEKENELSYLCGMIQSGKISHKDAIHYLDLMKEEYELEEKQFDGLYAEWIRNGDIGRELNRIGKQEKDPDSRKPYDYVLDGLYEMVEYGEIDLDMVTENLWEDPYEVRKDPVKGYTGFYPEFPGCIGYGENQEMLRMNMKKALRNWIYAAYAQWTERRIIGGK